MNQVKTETSLKHLWLVLVFAFLAALWVQLPNLTRPDAVEEDFRTLYWIQSYRDDALFPNAPFDRLGVSVYEIGGRRIAIEDSSPGYSLLFFAAAQIMRVELFHKLLVFPLIATAVFYIYRIGERLNNRRTAVGLAIAFTLMNLTASTEISVIGGLHRSFVTPILLGLLYYLLVKRYRAAAVSVFIAGFVYMPIFPVTVITYFLTTVRWRKNGRLHPTIHVRPLFPLAIAVFLVLTAVFPMILNQFARVQDGVNAMAGSQSLPILQDPVYQPGGRRPLFRVFPLVGRGGIVTGDMESLYLLFMSIFSVLIWLIRRRATQRLPAEGRHLFAACLIGYALAWSAIIFLSSFLFYIPSRHTQTGFFLLLLIFVGTNAGAALTQIAGWMQRNRQQLGWIILPVVVLVIGVVLFLPQPEADAPVFMRGTGSRLVLTGLAILLAVITVLVVRRRQTVPPASKQAAVTETAKQRQLRMAAGIGLLVLISPLYLAGLSLPFFSPPESQRALFTFMETIPKRSLVGGDPCSLDSVPFYGKRTVLFSCERFGFLRDRDEVVMDTLQAYYAQDIEDVRAYCRAYGLDYLVVDTSRFQPQAIAGGEYFYEPYDDWLAADLKSRPQFALASVPASERLFAYENLYVVACEKRIVR